MVHGVSTISGLAKPRKFDQILKRVHLSLNAKGLIDLKTWMTGSTAVRTTRASPGAPKKGP